MLNLTPTCFLWLPTFSPLDIDDLEIAVALLDRGWLGYVFTDRGPEFKYTTRATGYFNFIHEFAIRRLIIRNRLLCSGIDAAVDREIRVLFIFV